MRTVDQLPDDPDLHRAILAYLSDYGLITTLLMPQGLRALTENIFLASLDHAMCFHRSFKMDQCLRYVCEGVTSLLARGSSTDAWWYPSPRKASCASPHDHIAAALRGVQATIFAGHGCVTLLSPACANLITDLVLVLVLTSKKCYRTR